MHLGFDNVSLVMGIVIFIVYSSFHIDSNYFCSIQISEADLSPELQPLPSSNILMVEVDNVQHEQFTVTEEVKVQKTHQSSALLHHLQSSDLKKKKKLNCLSFFNTHVCNVMCSTGADSRDSKDHQRHHCT